MSSRVRDVCDLSLQRSDLSLQSSRLYHLCHVVTLRLRCEAFLPVGCLQVRGLGGSQSIIHSHSSDFVRFHLLAIVATRLSQPDQNR